MDTVHEGALAAAGVRADGTIDINAALRSLLEGLLNAVMDEQASELGAARNGYRERRLDTCVGTVFSRLYDVAKPIPMTYFALLFGAAVTALALSPSRGERAVVW